MSTRTVVIWCPNWSLVAAAVAGIPSAVLRGNRVISCSPSARSEGVRIRQRRREAEAACYDLVFIPEDPVRDLRAYEPVVTAISEFTPRVEVSRPGVCSLPARGPARYFGGEELLASKIAGAVNRLLAVRNAPLCRIGVADSPFAARLAAQAATTAPPAGKAMAGAGVGTAAGAMIVPPGETGNWLSRYPVSALGVPDLGELLTRLGIKTLGDFAGLDEGVVGARFGAEGALAHRLARGLDDQHLVLSDPPPDLSIERSLDEPVNQVETVAFIAASLAEELVGRLQPRGLACSHLLVEAATENAEELSRTWRADRPFTARAMVDRVRWQLEGWLSSAIDAPTAGITMVRLTAGEVVPDRGRQASFWGDPVEASQRVERGIARIQGILGHEAIGTAILKGGRGPAEQTQFIPWGEPRDEAARSSRHPWPGRVPSPAPALVFDDPAPTDVVDQAGEAVGVTGRGSLTASPVWMVRASRWAEVVGWAGPWPADERWWDISEHRRRARLQVLLDDGSAHLLSLEGGKWRIEGSYD